MFRMSVILNSRSSIKRGGGAQKCQWVSIGCKGSRPPQKRVSSFMNSPLVKVLGFWTRWAARVLHSHSIPIHQCIFCHNKVFAKYFLKVQIILLNNFFVSRFWLFQINILVYFLKTHWEFIFLKPKAKHRKSCEKLRWELVGCQGVKVFLLKDVIITTSVTTVIFITITILVFELSQFNCFSFARFEFLSMVTIWSFKFCHNFVFLSFVTVWVLEFCHNLGFFLVL